MAVLLGIMTTRIIGVGIGISADTGFVTVISTVTVITDIDIAAIIGIAANTDIAAVGSTATVQDTDHATSIGPLGPITIASTIEQTDELALLAQRIAVAEVLLTAF